MGAMGLPMATHLLRAGYPVSGYDLDSERMGRLSERGGQGAESAGAVVDHSDIIFTSLPSPGAFGAVAREEILPRIREDQVLIDVGTTTTDIVREISNELTKCGAHLLDAPVTGGVGGAESGNLWFFVGGTQAVLESCRHILAVIGDPAKIVHCGPSGSGQVTKGVNQLAMGLVNAALLESIAYGVRNGVTPEVLEAIAGDHGWRSLFRNVLRSVRTGSADRIGVKSGQLSYFLRDAAELGFSMPLSEGLERFLRDADRTVMEANRWSASFWTELNR